MPRRLLLDTNVVLDSIIEGRPDRVSAILLFQNLAYSHEVDGVVSGTTLKDAYYVVTKHGGEAMARRCIRALMGVVEIAAVDEQVCRAAVESNEPDFEDGIIRACAEREKVDFIISRDEKAFAHSPIRRLSAKEYVELFGGFTEADL